MPIKCFVFAIASVFLFNWSSLLSNKAGRPGVIGRKAQIVCTYFFGLRNGGMGVKAGHSGPALRCELPVACHFISGSSSVK